MGKTSINLQPDLGRDVITQLQQAITELDPAGEITITIESSEANQADSIISLLNENGFDYQTKDSHDGKNVYINAKRKLH